MRGGAGEVDEGAGAADGGLEGVDAEVEVKAPGNMEDHIDRAEHLEEGKSE